MELKNALDQSNLNYISDLKNEKSKCEELHNNYIQEVTIIKSNFQNELAKNVEERLKDIL